MAYTSCPIFEKIVKRYPIFTVQLINYHMYLHAYSSKNDMGTYQLRFIFGIDLSEAPLLKCTRNFFKNSLRENITIYDQRHKLP